MKIEIDNGALDNVVSYLPKLQLSGRGNRARQKLMQKLYEKFKDFSNDLEEIKSNEDKEVQHKEFKVLLEEKSVLDMSEYEPHMHTLYDLMLDYPHEISTSTVADGIQKVSDAVVHDYVIDALENAINEKKAEEIESIEVVE